MEILMLRHGQTAGNALKLFNGSGTDEPLSEDGRGMLEVLTDRFQPDAVYSSPMKRATETAEICFPGMKPRIISDLREMHFGDYEGRSSGWLTANDPTYQKWVDSGCTLPCPNGEAFGDFSDRATRAFRLLLENAKMNDFKKIAVVSHGGTIMCIMEYLSKSGNVFSRFAKNGRGFILSLSENGSLDSIGEL